LDLTVPLSPQAAADEDDRNFADVAVWHFATLQARAFDVRFQSIPDFEYRYRT
jgi:hypothetical protein